jgi:hypothetical protein
MIAPRRETNKQIARVEGAHFFSATREGLNRGRRKHGLRGFFSDESTLALESGGMVFRPETWVTGVRGHG